MAVTPTTRRRWPAPRRRSRRSTASPTNYSAAASTPTNPGSRPSAGFPAVVNVWASWCGPCRFEFPSFQQVSARYGKRVAFLAINNQDSDAAAETFLGEQPVPYPSYTDPDNEIADSIGASRGLPDTAFYSPEGKLLFLKQGPYDDEAELQEDVERYALAPAGGGESG